MGAPATPETPSAPTRNHLLLATVALAGLALFVGLAGAASAGHQATVTVCPDGSCDYTTIQSAVDDVDEHTTIDVQPGVYEENVTVTEPGTTIAGEGATLDATGFAPPALDVPEPHVTVRGLEVRWTATPDVQADRPTAIHTTGGAFELLDAEVHVQGGGCTPGAVADCEDPYPSRGVTLLGSSLVDERAHLRNVTVAADLPAEGGTVGGDTGIIAEDALLEDVRLRDWAERAVYARAGPVDLEHSTVAQSGLGVDAARFLEALRVEDTTFEHNDVAVRFDGDPDDADGSGPSHATITESDLDRSNRLAIQLANGTEGVDVDAVRNHWGVLGEELIRDTRIEDQGTGNSVAVVPYLDATGAQHPARPAVLCYVDTEDGLEPALEEVARTTTLQGAVDLALPQRCLDADDSGSVERVVELSQGAEAYRGATVTSEVLVRTQDPSPVQTDGVRAGGAAIQAAADQPALAFLAGSNGSAVDSVTVEGPGEAVGVHVEGVAAPGVTVRSLRAPAGPSPLATGVLATGTTGVTVEDSVVVAAGPAVHVRDSGWAAVRVSSLATTGAQGTDAAGPATVLADGLAGGHVADNVVHGPSLADGSGVHLASADDVRVERNVVAGADEAIVLDASRSASVQDNVVTVDPSLDGTVAVRASGGSGHELARNLLKGAGTGLAVDGAEGVSSQQDEARLVATGVHVASLDGTGTQAPMLEVHNASLAATTTPLALADTTSSVPVDAECNNWGAYHADLIEARIQDDGSDNTVDYQPWTSANQKDPTATCLTPPDADFTAEPWNTTRDEEVQFLDESEEGTRPILEWAWDFGDGATSEEQNPSHVYSEVGHFPVVLRVEDADGMVSREVKQVTVWNLAPELDPVEDETLHHTGEVVKELSAQDEEGDNVTFDAYLAGEEPRRLPAGASLTDHGDGTATFTWDPSADQDGVYEIVFEADDGQPLNSKDTETATITVTNDAPVFDPALPDLVETAETRTLSVDVHAEEPDPDTLESLTADLSELPADATFTVDTGDDGVPNDATLEWTPGIGDAGTYEVPITASGPGKTTTHTLTIEVVKEVPPPGLVPDAATEAAEGTVVDVVVNADVASEAPRDVVGWDVAAEVVRHENGSTERAPFSNDSVSTSGNTATWSGEMPTGADRVEVTVSADDGYGPARKTIAIDVQLHPELDLDLPAEARTGVSTVQPIHGEALSFGIEAGDGDGSIQNVTVQPSQHVPAIAMERSPALGAQDAGTWTLDLDEQTAAEAYPEPGTYNATYEVTDDDGLTTTSTQTIHVQENLPPEVDASPDVRTGQAQSADGLKVDLRGSASDPNGRQLPDSAYEWVLDGEVLATGPRASPSVPVGDHTLELQVTDAYGATGTATVDVAVDDFIRTDADLVGADEKLGERTYRLDPAGSPLERHKAWVSVDTDQFSPVEGAQLNVTATYYGAQSSEQGTAYATSQVTTPANGTALVTWNKQFNGQLDRGENLASAPGYHEVTVEASADSRPADPFGDVERDTLTLGYWVGPAGTGPSGG